MKRWFWVIVALQMLFLTAEVATKEISIRTAQTVILKAEPVDPRSLFAGQYMDLSYSVSTIHLDRTWLVVRRNGQKPHPGDTVYVRLRPGKRWPAELVDVALDRPQHAVPGLVSLKGTVMDVYDDIMRVEYGLERYYIPEDKADDVAKLQQWNRNRQPNITVHVAVTGSGQGMIKRIMVDGKPLGF